ncbi:MAG: NAD-dependent DNA ligase LigA [bacterium]|nr:NAD-dependent DNA ligase LigA [bacterium]
MSSKSEYLKLVNKLIQWDHAYYVLDAPLVSDYDYDMALKEAHEIEIANPDWQLEFSPTSRVSGEVAEQFNKGTHPYQLMSLSNVYNNQELEEYVSRLRKLLISNNDPAFFCETKFDGLSMAIYYKGGYFSHALTRGDGKIGEDVSSNIKTIRSIPLKLPENIDLCLRAEVVMPRDEFLKLNMRQEEEGSKIFANPRNAAAGTVRQLDSTIAAKRGLDAYFYDILDRETHSITTHQQAIDMLRQLGFKTDPLSAYCADIREVIDFYTNLGKKRHTLNYDLDGVVIKVNDYSLYEELGSTGKSPRWAVAFKYEAEQAQTVIKNITVQVGRTGVLTPVAEFEPVFLAGSTVRFASLHNWDEIRSKDIRIGDHVKIEKAGDIIPQVVTVLIEQRDSELDEFELPVTCPACNSEVTQLLGEVAFRCQNEHCVAKLLGKLKHFVSRDALNIQGVGESILEQLLKLNMIGNPLDLFGLEIDDFLRLKETKEKLATKLFNAVQDRKKIELGRFIYALGIPHVGLQSAYLLAESFQTLDAILEVNKQDLESLDGIGPVMADSIAHFFDSEYCLKVIQSIKQYNVAIEDVSSKSNNLNNNGILSSESICFTGKLERFSRSKAQEIAKENGAIVQNSLSKSTTILVYGEKAGSKLKKAQGMGIQLWTEDEFFEKVELSD